MNVFKRPRNSSSMIAILLLCCGLATGRFIFNLENKASAANAKPKAVSLKAQPLKIEKKQFPQGLLYVFTVSPHSGYKVIPALSKTLAAIDSQIWQNIGKTRKPVFLLNGGYFDPTNSLTTSFVFQGGILTADPRINPHLVNNPKLLPILPKIFNRSEFRMLLCQSASGQFQTRYDIAPHNAPIQNHCLLQSSLGAGPALLPVLNGLEEGFLDYNAAGKLTRDPIGVCARNARSAVGLTDNGTVVLMMGAQNPAKPSNSGFSLADMAGLMKARGVIKALSLDGGSSSSLFYENKPVFGKAASNGKVIKRSVKSVLMVVPAKS